MYFTTKITRHIFPSSNAAQSVPDYLFIQLQILGKHWKCCDTILKHFKRGPLFPFQSFLRNGFNVVSIFTKDGYRKVMQGNKFKFWIFRINAKCLNSLVISYTNQVKTFDGKLVLGKSCFVLFVLDTAVLKAFPATFVPRKVSILFLISLY